MLTIGTFFTIFSPSAKILRPKKFVTSIPRMYTNIIVRIIPKPGISIWSFFNKGPEISSSVLNKNLITKKVK